MVGVVADLDDASIAAAITITIVFFDRVSIVVVQVAGAEPLIDGVLDLMGTFDLGRAIRIVRWLSFLTS